MHRSDHATGGAGQHGVLALKQAGGGQPTGRHHELKLCGGLICFWQVLAYAAHIVAQNRCEIGIGHGRAGASDKLHQRNDLMAHRNMGKAQIAGQRSDLALMRWIAIAVQKTNGDGVAPPGMRVTKRAFNFRQIRWCQFITGGIHARICFDGAGI